MRFMIQFTGEDGRMHSESNLTAAQALERYSVLLSPVNRPLVYVLDEDRRDYNEEELVDLAKKEAGDA